MKLTFAKGLIFGGIGGSLLFAAIERTCFPPRPEPIEKPLTDYENRIATIARREQEVSAIARDVVEGRMSFEEGLKLYHAVHEADPQLLESICLTERTQDKQEATRRAFKKRLAAVP